MKKPIRLTFLVFIIFVAICIFFFIWLNRIPSPTKQNYDQIVIGMHESQVEDIVGPCDYEESLIVNKTLSKSKNHNPGKKIVRSKGWYGHEINFYVEFDDNDLVVGKQYFECYSATWRWKQWIKSTFQIDP